MSRNLCTVHCRHCGEQPTVDEMPRLVLQEEVNGYWDEYQGMMVANATCVCGAKYLAWVTQSTWHRARWPSEPSMGENGYFDLSYRSTFDDEPGLDDLPLFEVDVVVTRTVSRVGPAELTNWDRHYEGRYPEKFAERRERIRAAWTAEQTKEVETNWSTP